MNKQEYFNRNRVWLDVKAKEPDAKPLDKGISQPGIPAGSTLIFDIELISVM